MLDQHEAPPARIALAPHDDEALPHERVDRQHDGCALGDEILRLRSLLVGSHPRGIRSWSSTASSRRIFAGARASSERVAARHRRSRRRRSPTSPPPPRAPRQAPESMRRSRPQRLPRAARRRLSGHDPARAEVAPQTLTSAGRASRGASTGRLCCGACTTSTSSPARAAAGSA